MVLLFDLDGTLTDSRIGIVRCFAHALQQIGRPSADLPLLVCIGPPLPVAFQMLLGSEQPALIERAITVYRERFERLGMFENALFPDVMEGLTAMQEQGHRMRVVTAKPQPYALKILKHFQIDTFFDAVHGPTLIGDRGEDVVAARVNGIQSIAVRWGYGLEAELVEAGPTHSVRTMKEIVRWLGMRAAS